MHRLTWVVVLASACVYDPPPNSEVRDDQEMPDADVDPTGSIACHSDSGPLLCIEFELGLTDQEQFPVAFDGSSQALHATATFVESTSRVMPPTMNDGAEAALFQSGSRLLIDRDVGIGGSVTVEMWIERDAFDFAQPAVLFDSSNRFFIERNDLNQIRCGINNDSSLSVSGATSISADGWHHVACVFDGTSTEMKVYVDGSVDDCRRLGRSIDPTQDGATTAGVLFRGAMDGLHVLPRALSAAELCTNAGRTSCDSTCPSNDSGPGPGGGGFGDDGGSGGPGG